MQTYNLRLESDASSSFRCQMAANSLDIDVAKKLVHELTVNCDMQSPFNVGLIVGASGSGKTTLAKQIFGQDCFNSIMDEEKPIIDQFPESLSYDECAGLLSGIGLTSVPCWIRPVKTLSNGQKARAEAALQMTRSQDILAVDEWTSVVDRTVAKVMSHCLQKFARRNNKRVVVNSCHYDVIEWLNPDWIIDCNSQTFTDRRLLPAGDRARKELLTFDIRATRRECWKYFSKYHYLSDKLPGGSNFLFGLFHGDNQIGFQCFSNYVPTKQGTQKMFHSNRTVIHPDYAGLGLGILLINETSKYMKANYPFRIMATFSSVPIYKSMEKSGVWKLKGINRRIGRMKTSTKSTYCRINPNLNSNAGGGFRENVKMFSFEYVG